AGPDYGEPIYFPAHLRHDTPSNIYILKSFLANNNYAQDSPLWSTTLAINGRFKVAPHVQEPEPNPGNTAPLQELESSVNQDFVLKPTLGNTAPLQELESNVNQDFVLKPTLGNTAPV